MPQTPVEVKKATPARTPDVWQSFRRDLDRLFDRFAGGFGLPAFRRMSDLEPGSRSAGSLFGFAAPAVDVTEDDKAFAITAELPGLEEKNIDVAVSGDMLTIKGEKRYERDESDKDRHMSEPCLRLVPALVRAAGRRRPRQDRRQAVEGRADDHLAQDGAGAEAAENRGQARSLIRSGLVGGGSCRQSST